MLKEKLRREEILSLLRQFAVSQGLTLEEIAAVFDRTLARQLEQYQTRLATIELPSEGFTHKRQAQAAKGLADAFRHLSQRQIDNGLVPTEKDKRVTEADRLRVRFEREQKKIQNPTRSGKQLAC